MTDSTDTRTMADLANEVIRAQYACNMSNMSGLVISFAKSISRLRVLLREQGRESTADINAHPICVLWVDTLQSLARGDSADNWYQVAHKAYNDVHYLAQR